MNTTEMAKILAPIAAAFPNWKPSKETYEVYRWILADVPVEALKVAVWQLLSQPRQFAPSAGELRAAALVLVEEATGSRLPTPFEAWEMVIDYCRERRPIRNPLVLRAARQLGGLSAIGMSSNPAAERARFIEAYSELLHKVQELRRLPSPVKQQYRKLLRSKKLLEAKDE